MGYTVCSRSGCCGLFKNQRDERLYPVWWSQNSYCTLPVSPSLALLLPFPVGRMLAMGGGTESQADLCCCKHHRPRSLDVLWWLPLWWAWTPGSILQTASSPPSSGSPCSQCNCPQAEAVCDPSVELSHVHTSCSKQVAGLCLSIQKFHFAPPPITCHPLAFTVQVSGFFTNNTPAFSCY